MNSLKDWINKPGLRTKDGRDVMVMFINPSATERFRYIGYIIGSSNAYHTWDENGCYDLNGSTNVDIIFPEPKKKKIEIWQNVYRDDNGRYFRGLVDYNSQADAFKARNTGGHDDYKYIITIKIHEFEIDE